MRKACLLPELAGVAHEKLAEFCYLVLIALSSTVTQLSLNQPLTLAEVETALCNLYNGRSAAMLGYTSELLRRAQLPATPEVPAPPHLLAPCLLVLFNAAFSTAQVPLSWKSSLVNPIFKKGDATDTANYTEAQQPRILTQASYRPQLGTMH